MPGPRGFTSGSYTAGCSSVGLGKVWGTKVGTPSSILQLGILNSQLPVVEDCFTEGLQ